MKHAIAVLCLLSCWLTITAGGRAQDLSQFDLSTDEGVNAAREAIAGKKLDERSKRCISRDQSLPGMVVVGGFAFDYGCRFQGVFINLRYVATEDKALSRNALEALGWKTANRELREKLAQAWLEKGLFAFVTVLRARTMIFRTIPFSRPGPSPKKTVKRSSRFGFDSHRGGSEERSINFASIDFPETEISPAARHWKTSIP